VKLLEQPKVCRFYQLTPYLETYKVEDIITMLIRLPEAMELA